MRAANALNFNHLHSSCSLKPTLKSTVAPTHTVGILSSWSIWMRSFTIYGDLWGSLRLMWGSQVRLQTALFLRSFRGVTSPPRQSLTDKWQSLISCCKMLCTWRLCHSVVEAGTFRFPKSAQDWQDGLDLVLLAHSVVSDKAIKSYSVRCLIICLW